MSQHAAGDRRRAPETGHPLGDRPGESISGGFAWSDARPQPYHAAVGRFAAFAIRSLIGEPAMVAQLTRLAAAGTDPQRILSLARAWRSICRAADEWTAAVAAEAAAPDPATLPGSAEVDTATAAIALGITDNRIRQLCRAGRLAARRDRAGRWQVNADAVRRACER